MVFHFPTEFAALSTRLVTLNLLESTLVRELTENGQRMDRELQSAIYQRRELRYPPLSFIIEHTSATVEVVFGKGFPSYSDIIIQLLSEPAGCIGTNRSTINCSMGTVLAASPLEITATFFGANVVNNPCRRYCNFPRPFNDPLPD